MLSLRDKGIVESLSVKGQTGDSSPGYDPSGSKIVFQKEPETSEVLKFIYILCLFFKSAKSTIDFSCIVIFF